MGDADLPFARFPLSRATLENGLRVVLHVDRRLPLVATNLWYHVGSKNERRGRTGLAHLFEHMLFQGSENVGTNDHFRHLQSVGGVANGSTWYDRTNYYETVPSNRLDLALWLESDRMGYLLPALDQAKLDNQREVVINERRQRVDNRPYARPYERLFELLIPPEHPYHWPVIGWVDDLEATTLDEVRDFFRTWYVPSNAVLTLAGDFDPDDALDRVRHWFGDLPSRPIPERRRWPLEPLAGPVRERVADRVRLPRVYVAFRIPPFGDDAWFAASLLSTLLGHGKSSPLYRDLVWERRIAQEAGAYVYPTEETGVFVAWATAKPGVEAATVAERLRHHLDALARSIAPDELERARRQTLAALLGELETLDARADRLSMYATLFDAPEASWNEAARYLQRSDTDLMALAAEWLGDEHAVELTVEPEPEGATP
jgi:zinc protease